MKWECHQLFVRPIRALLVLLDNATLKENTHHTMTDGGKVPSDDSSTVDE